MSGPRKLNPIERGFVATMNTMTRVTQGYEVAFTEELVRQQGIGGFFKWAGATQGIWNEMVAMFGEPNAHLLASFASFWNGCDYCAYGHMLAYNLHHFEHEDALFAIDEREVPVLLRKRDSEILGLVKERLAGRGPGAAARARPPPGRAPREPEVRRHRRRPDAGSHPRALRVGERVQHHRRGPGPAARPGREEEGAPRPVRLGARVDPGRSARSRREARRLALSRSQARAPLER